MLVCPECGASEATVSICPRDGSKLLDRGHDTLLGTAIGNYRIARLLGRGGMGSVYKGVNPQIGSSVAVKVIATADRNDSAAVERFFAEARIVNLIREEHIVNVLDLGWLGDGRPYIMMEYVEGVPLSALMQRPEGIGARQLVGLVLQILDALVAAHAKGVVHRDLKPDNVMVTPLGRAKVLDFGIAKLRREGQTTHGLTASGAVLGTPYYMSPEQALARRVDARSDLYSLGVILYQGLTGRVPFTGDSMFEVLQQQVEAPPPPLRALRPELPEAFESIVLKTLAKNPEQRPESALELRELLIRLQPQLPELGGTAAHGPGRIPGVASQLVASVPSGVNVWSAPSFGAQPAPVAPRWAAPAPGAPSSNTSGVKWAAVGALGVSVVAMLGVALVLGILWWRRGAAEVAERPATLPPTAENASGVAPPALAPTTERATPAAPGLPDAPAEAAARPLPGGAVPTPKQGGAKNDVAVTPTRTNPAPAAPAPAIAPIPVPAADPTTTEATTVAPPVAVSVSISSGSVVGGQDPVATLRLGRQRAQGSVRACYVKVLTTKPETQGTLNMGLQISPEGTTRGVGVRGSFLDSNFIACVNRSFLAITFPLPENGKLVNVEFQVTVSKNP